VVVDVVGACCVLEGRDKQDPRIGGSRQGTTPVVKISIALRCLTSRLTHVNFCPLCSYSPPLSSFNQQHTTRMLAIDIHQLLFVVCLRSNIALCQSDA
jgi:hypothetical protein